RSNEAPGRWSSPGSSALAGRWVRGGNRRGVPSSRLAPRGLRPWRTAPIQAPCLAAHSRKTWDFRGSGVARRVLARTYLRGRCVMADAGGYMSKRGAVGTRRGRHVAEKTKRPPSAVLRRDRGRARSTPAIVGTRELQHFDA